MASSATAAVARIDGVPLAAPDEILTAAELRQRACTELLRQAAQRAGLLALDDPAPVPGVASEAASAAIEALLAREVVVAPPDENACRRYYAAHRRALARGERLRLRHILFAVTPGVDVAKLRERAETTLHALRVSDAEAGQRFISAARDWSNCPSAAVNGDLGWLEQHECAPEFAREVFGRIELGVLPRLVHSRHGFHIVEALERIPGAEQPYEAVRGAIEAALARRLFAVEVRQYLMRLASEALVEGVDLQSADEPLVQ